MSTEPNIRGDVGLLPGDPNRSFEIRLANPIKPADFDLLLLMSLLGLKDLLAPLSLLFCPPSFTFLTSPSSPLGCTAASPRFVSRCLCSIARRELLTFLASISLKL